jgi:hypothetical protein
VLWLAGTLVLALVLTVWFVLAVFVEPQPLTRTAGATSRQRAK